MHEHRSDRRIEEHADVSIKVQSAPQARDLEGRVFPFHSEDISVYGLRLGVDIPVPIGSLLELEIVLDSSSMKYRHLANVIWADAVSEDLEHGCRHDMGVRLQTQSNPQFDSWATAVANL